MLTGEAIKTWSWRVKKAGMTADEFCKLLNISPSHFSEYCNGKRDCLATRFDLIEGKLKELGV